MIRNNGELADLRQPDTVVANSLAELLDGKIGDTASRAEAHQQTLDARISRERGEVEEMLAVQRG